MPQRYSSPSLYACHGPGETRSIHLRASDLIALVPFKEAGREGGPDSVLVYIMVEAQSKPDPGIAYRVLRDMVFLWERQLRQENGKRRRRASKVIRNLRPIVPVVLYNWQ